MRFPLSPVGTTALWVDVQRGRVEKLFRLCFLTLVPFPHDLSRVFFFPPSRVVPTLLSLPTAYTLPSQSASGIRPRIDSARDRNMSINLVMRSAPSPAPDTNTAPPPPPAPTPLSRRVLIRGGIRSIKIIAWSLSS